MQHKYVKKEYIFLLIISIILIMIVLTIIYPKKQYKVDTYTSINANYIDKANKKNSITQVFKADKDYESFGILIGTYAKRINNGELNVSIYGNNKKKKFVTKASTLIDNHYLYYNYNIVKNEKYIIKIKAKNFSSNIALFTTEDKHDNSKLYVNSKSLDSNLKLAFRYKVNSYYNTYYLSFVLVIALIYGVLNIDLRSMSYEKV